MVLRAVLRCVMCAGGEGCVQQAAARMSPVQLRVGLLSFVHAIYSSTVLLDYRKCAAVYPFPAG